MKLSSVESEFSLSGLIGFPFDWQVISKVWCQEWCSTGLGPEMWLAWNTCLKRMTLTTEQV